MSLLNIMIILAMIFMPVVYADKISLKEVEALEKQCEEAQEPLFKLYRDRLISDCEKIEQVNRGDPENCAERFKNEIPVLITPIPICVKADEAHREYYGLEQ